MNGTTPHTNGTTKHATMRLDDAEDPIVIARTHVHEALDALDHLLGLALGVIDDRACAPDETDAARVRKVARRLRSKLLGAASELSATMSTVLEALDNYSWPATDPAIVEAVTTTILDEAREHERAYIPASFWRTRITAEIAKVAKEHVS